MSSYEFLWFMIVVCWFDICIMNLLFYNKDKKLLIYFMIDGGLRECGDTECFDIGFFIR